MDIKTINKKVSVAPQIKVSDVADIAKAGFKTLINNRPDNEEKRQPKSASMKTAAEKHGLVYYDIPIVGSTITKSDIAAFEEILKSEPGAVLAFCRTGTRSINLWGLSQAGAMPTDEILAEARKAGYDLSTIRSRLDEKVTSSHYSSSLENTRPDFFHQILIVGGGSAGIGVAASLLKRQPNLDIGIIEPSDVNYYQPGWTMVGGGIFPASKTVRKTADILPKSVKWIKNHVLSFEPENQSLTLADGKCTGYETLIAAPGLQLDFDKIDGLVETLGKNGVTSNYRFDLAPYTWELVQKLEGGTALFTQPPMPIKCAGAPQKVMYLSADTWRKNGKLSKFDIHFCTAGGAIFGVAAYVPALLKYIKKYGISLDLNETLVAVDGAAHKAWFDQVGKDGQIKRIERSFDMLHVCPPQSAPDFIKTSPLANEDGWIDVNAETLQHNRYKNIYALGDAGSMPNAKTMAAARKQIPVVAENVLADRDGKKHRAIYEGYGSCPLTVEHGKIVLAEFGYGGALQPTFPTWLINGLQPSKLAWFLKIKVMPSVYWNLMLKGREWLAKPPSRRTPGL